MNDDNTQFGMPAVDPQQSQAYAQADAAQYAPAAMPSSTPVSAEDIDLIEKEWVEKAKQIVHSTQGDPHAQSQRLSEMKADYIKKRYNREVKPSK